MLRSLFKLHKNTASGYTFTYVPLNTYTHTRQTFTLFQHPLWTHSKDLTLFPHHFLALSLVGFRITIMFTFFIPFQRHRLLRRNFFLAANYIETETSFLFVTLRFVSIVKMHADGMTNVYQWPISGCWIMAFIAIHTRTHTQTHSSKMWPIVANQM